MSILVIAEHDNNELKVATLNTVAAASQLGTVIEVLVAGLQCEAVANQAAQIPGIEKVLLADKPAYANFLPENIGSLITEIGTNYTHILSPATANGKNFLPRVAASLDVAQVSDISAVVNEDTFERPIYAGNCIASVQSTDAI